MKILKFDDRDEWLAARRGKITGSRLKDIVVKRGTGEKIGFYELIAERLGLPADDENPMDRGNRLQEEAIERFEKVTGKKVDSSLQLWVRDDDESIALSPDGVIKKGKEAVEIKCLGSARHIEAVVTGQIPSEYEFQKLQYFITNDELEKLHFVFYDPRLKVQDFFVVEVKREDVKAEVEMYLAYQREKLAKVDEIVKRLAF